MDEIQLKVTGTRGSGKSVLLSLIESLLSYNKIPYTLLEDEHLMKVSMGDFIEHRSAK